MKYWLLVTWLFGTTLAGYAQSAASYAQLAKLVELPGVVFVRDSLWMDEAEISNIHWVEYLNLLRKDSSAAFYRSQLPDAASVWRYTRADWSGEEFALYNLRFSEWGGLNYYPAVGIYFAQAVNYCKWRTAVVNKRLHSGEYLRKHPKLRKYDFRVEYRLPTEREWTLAAAGGLNPTSYPLGKVHPLLPGSADYRQQRLGREAAAACVASSESQNIANVRLMRMEFKVRENVYLDGIGTPFFCISQVRSLPECSAGTEYIYANPPNAYGLYNMVGNVAELTATPGVAKGGSFEDSINDLSVTKSLPYTGPQAWLGFRCACTVHIRPKP